MPSYGSQMTMYGCKSRDRQLTVPIMEVIHSQSRTVINETSLFGHMAKYLYNLPSYLDIELDRRHIGSA